MSSRGFAFLQPHSADFYLDRRYLIQQSQSNNLPLSEGSRTNAPSLSPLSTPGPPCQPLSHPFTCGRSLFSSDQRKTKWLSKSSELSTVESKVIGRGNTCVGKAGKSSYFILLQFSYNFYSESCMTYWQRRCRGVGVGWEVHTCKCSSPHAHRRKGSRNKME